MPFGQRLRDARLARGLTQLDLARAAGVHHAQIGRYENKGAVPAADVLARMADALGVAGDFLISGSADEHAGAELRDKDLLAHFKLVERMPPTDRDVVKALIDAFATKHQLRKLVA